MSDTVGEIAAGYVDDGMKVGLGTGRAATEFVNALGERVRKGLRVTGVPTSEATRKLAEKLGIPLATLAEAGALDLTIDGADEIDPGLRLIKGLGGALVREKIVAASSARFVVVAGDEKLVERLGEKTPVPVEVLPFGLSLCERRLAALGSVPVLRQAKSGGSYVTDNGNNILDCKFSSIDDAAALDRTICAIPGVLGSGLFSGMAERALVQTASEVRVILAARS